MKFKDIIKAAQSASPKRIVVAAAHDSEVLQAVSEASRLGIVLPVLVGDTEEIKRLAALEGIDLSGAELVYAEDNAEAVRTAISIVRTGSADILMKGMLSTAELLRGVLNKDWGLAAGGTLSHVAAFESLCFDRMLLMTDSAMVMYPDIKVKANLIRNAVGVARALGVETPKVACIAAVETINSDMPATLDAAALTLMGSRGQISGCVIDGPLALDNALSVEAARHKKIESPVAGQADILLMPNIEAGNVFFKAAHYLGNCKIAGIIVGAKAPIVLTSRTDTPESKLNSIAVAILASR